MVFDHLAESAATERQIRGQSDPYRKQPPALRQEPASKLLDVVARQQLFPFTAIVGQDEMKLALVLVAIDPTIGGVLALGDRGTGKSTSVRALSAVLPPIAIVRGCPYNSDPEQTTCDCAACREKVATEFVPVRIVELPLGATEDRVVGALNIEQALVDGVKAFEPGLLARANRGFLYIDEVNLLEDHLVDLLIDVAASGENVVEREGLSVRHPARFVLVGSGNPEEGELRPQLLDRFGLSAEVKTPTDLDTRVEVVLRRDRFERDKVNFFAEWTSEEESLRGKIIAARRRLPAMETPPDVIRRAAELCLQLGTDGLRGELTLLRAARALAALQGEVAVSTDHLRHVAASCLRHRMRRNPLDDAGSTVRVERAVATLFEK